MCQIISMELASLCFTSLIPLSKFFIGLAKICTLLREMLKVFLLALESKFNFLINRINVNLFLPIPVLIVASLVCGLMVTWIKEGVNLAALMEMKHYLQKKTLLLKHSNAGHLFKLIKKNTEKKGMKNLYFIIIIIILFVI